MALNISNSGIWNIATGAEQEVLDILSKEGGDVTVFGFTKDPDGNIVMLYKSI